MYKTVNTGSYLKYCTIASKRFLKPILIVMSMEKLPEFNQETMKIYVFGLQKRLQLEPQAIWPLVL